MNECSICDQSKSTGMAYCEQCLKEDVGWMLDKLSKRVNDLKGSLADTEARDASHLDMYLDLMDRLSE